MRTSIARAHRPGEVKPVDLPLIGATPRKADSPTAVNPADGDWILGVAAEALDRVMQRKEAAITMGMDQAQMTRQLSGDGHLSLRRLGLLGENYWREFANVLRDRFGMEDDEARLRRALDGMQACVSVIGEIAMKGARR